MWKKEKNIVWIDSITDTEKLYNPVTSLFLQFPVVGSDYDPEERHPRLWCAHQANQRPERFWKGWQGPQVCDGSMMGNSCMALLIDKCNNEV